MENVMIDYSNDNNRISIGFLHPAYVNALVSQDKMQEMQKIKNFVEEYAIRFIKEKGFNPSYCHLQFINYGSTELVYVLTLPNDERFTFLIKQPAVDFGQVKKEAVHLTNLAKQDDCIIYPISYYASGGQEGYITPYENQARCVASDDEVGDWGMYIPEPYYRFEKFTPNQRKVVNCCMIAKLVSLYDFDKGCGIAKAKLGGGDFMLPKGWEKSEHTIKQTLGDLKLIACRERVYLPFEKYLEVIRKEFSQKTIYMWEKDCLVNIRGRVEMTSEEIEEGIALGKKILKEKLINNKNKENSEKI